MYIYTNKINLPKNNDKQITANELFNEIKRTSEGYEVIKPDTPVVPYFDYDYLYHTEEERAKSFDADLKRVLAELGTCYDLSIAKIIIFISNGIDTDKKCAEDRRPENLRNEQAKARPNKRTLNRLENPMPYYKNSINVILRGCGYFKSNQNIIQPTKGTFDKNVYSTYQLIRAPFATKCGQNRFKNLYTHKRIYNIDTFTETGLTFEELLITNIKGEILINNNIQDITIDDVQLSDDETDIISVVNNVKSEITSFTTTKHLKHLLLCLKIDRIDNMTDWLVLMRICKNIMKTFTSDDVKIAKDIIHKHMGQTPEKYKFDEVEAFLNKEEECNEVQATWGSLAKMAKEDNPRHYEKLLKRTGKVKKGDIFNEDRLKRLMKEPRQYYWGDYGKFNSKKYKEPDEILKYMIDTTYKIMNGGKPYYITMNKTFKEFTKTGEMIFNYEFKTINQNPFNAVKKCCIFKIRDTEYDLFDFSTEFFQKYHFMNAEMMPYAGLDDPFKKYMNMNYRILNRFEGFRMAKYTTDLICGTNNVSKGTCEKMLYHIKYIICGNDEELYKYVIGWLAWIIQHPEIKHETCLLLQGIEGCGKNKFVEIVKRILGETVCFDTYNIDDIIGGFNSQLSGKLLIIGDELVGYAGFKKSDFIKGMLTSPNISITKKGVDTIAEKSFQRYIFTTNNDETLRISNNDRRICIIGVLDDMKGNYTYFSALTAEMDDLDNIKCLYDYLANYDISNYDFRKAPETALKTETINNQLDDIYNWFTDYVDELKICGNEILIKSKEAYESYSEYTNKFMRRKDFNHKMKKLLKCEYVRRKNGRNYVFNVNQTNDMFMKLYKNDIKILNVDGIDINEPYDSDDKE